MFDQVDPRELRTGPGALVSPGGIAIAQRTSSLDARAAWRKGFIAEDSIPSNPAG